MAETLDPFTRAYDAIDRVLGESNFAKRVRYRVRLGSGTNTPPHPKVSPGELTEAELVPQGYAYDQPGGNSKAARVDGFYGLNLATDRITVPTINAAVFAAVAAVGRAGNLGLTGLVRSVTAHPASMTLGVESQLEPKRDWQRGWTTFLVFAVEMYIARTELTNF